MTETTLATAMKTGAALVKYLSVAGEGLRDRHYARLWERFWDEADPSKREQAVLRIASEDEPRFAAWLFNLFVQVNEEKTMKMLGQWTVQIGLSDRSIDYFYRGARGITQTFAEDLESLVIYAQTLSDAEMRPEAWEAITLAGFARRTLSTSGFSLDGPSELEARAKYEITELGVDFLASQGIAWPPA